MQIGRFACSLVTAVVAIVLVAGPTPYQPDAGTACGEKFVNKTNNTFGSGYFDGFQRGRQAVRRRATSARGTRCPVTSQSAPTSLRFNRSGATRPPDASCPDAAQNTKAIVPGCAFYPQAPAARSIGAILTADCRRRAPAPRRLLGSPALERTRPPQGAGASDQGIVTWAITCCCRLNGLVPSL